VLQVQKRRVKKEKNYKNTKKMSKSTPFPIAPCPFPFPFALVLFLARDILFSSVPVPEFHFRWNLDNISFPLSLVGIYAYAVAVLVMARKLGK